MFDLVAINFIIILIAIGFLIFLIAVLLLILLLISLLFIHRHIAYYIAFRVSYRFNGSFGSSFVLILLVNIRINALYKGFSLRTPKPGFKALIRFNNVGFKIVLRVSKKVLSGTKYIFIFGAY